jgi:splicing factor 3B subunit 2
VKPKLEDEDMAVDYVSERLDVSDAALEAFSDVFARFQLPPELSTVRLPPKIRSLVSLD